MTDSVRMLDPTPERSPVRRERIRPPETLEGLTVGLLDISKIGGDVFLARLAVGLRGRGLQVKHYVKPTFTRAAPAAMVASIAEECGVVVEALAD